MSPVDQRLDPDADVAPVLMLYGATMVAVQGLEHEIAWLYVVVNTEASKVSSASLQRQWRDAARRLWNGFQKASAGMRLNDAKRGLKPHLDDALYAELDRFIKGPRNQLAHRFLIERLLPTDDGAARFRSGTAAELVETAVQADRLSQRLHERADEVRAGWPAQPEVPAEVREFAEVLGRMAMRKEFPAPP